jgi:hypothetical protein
MNNIVFASKRTAPVVDEDIILNGAVIGFVKKENRNDPYCPNTFHVGLQVNVGDMWPHLIQGHGESRELAIADAIRVGSSFALKLVTGIENLLKSLEEETNVG